MILNAYAVLDAFLCALRGLLGVFVLGLALGLWRVWRPGLAAEARQVFEDRGYLLSLTAVVLLVLNIASWPLFYLLLQSYVHAWPGIMCVYGVTQIGRGSIGASGYLPLLLQLLQAAKPVLVFISGAWLVLYVVNRQTPAAPLTGRVLGLLIVLGACAVADAGVETAYLVIPKAEETLSVGCCTEFFDAPAGGASLLPEALQADTAHVWLYGTYYTTNGLMLAGLLYLAGRGRATRGGLTLLALGALGTLAVSGAFLVDTAAPRLLHLPYHHCPYDLLPKAPESLVGVALFALGTLAVGWAWVAGWLGRSEETLAVLPRMVRQLLMLALWGYGGSLVVMSLELALS